MKKCLSSILFLALVSVGICNTSCFSQIMRQVYPDHEVHDYLALARWNGDTIYAAGNNSGFMRSTNAGLTWTPVFHTHTGYSFTRMGVNATGVYLLPEPTLPTNAQFQDTTRMFIFRYDPRTDDTTRISIPCPVPFRREWLGLVASIFVVDEGVFVVQSALPYTSAPWTNDRKTSLLFRANADTNWSAITFPDSMNFQRPTICFRDSRRGVVFGSVYNGAKTFYFTTDGGSNWSTDENIGFYTSLLSSVVDPPAQWVDDTTFIVATDKYVIQRTTDMGKTWKSLSTVPTPAISSFAFLPSGFGIVSGQYLDICRTSDFGATWEIIHPQYPYGFALAMRSLMLDSATSITAGYDGHILRSTDAGVTWDMPLINAFNYSPYFFVTDEIGFGSRWPNFEDTGVEYCTTSDGGRTWSDAFRKDFVSGTMVCPVDMRQIWAVNLFPTVRDDLVYLSTDGGMMWNAVCRSSMFDTSGVLVPVGLRGVFSCGKDSFMVYTDHGILRTTDRGTTWDMEKQILDIPRGTLYSFAALYANTHPYQWFISEYQVVRSGDFGKTWVVVDSFPDRPDPLPTILNASVIDGNTVFIHWEGADWKDRLSMTTDGGTTWREIVNEQSIINSLTDVCVFSGGTGYGLTKQATMHQTVFLLYKTEDYWHSAKPIYSFSLSARTSYSPMLYFRNSTCGWIGIGPELYQTTNGGIDWVESRSLYTPPRLLESIYPNPVKSGEAINFVFTNRNVNPISVCINVYDCLGRNVYTNLNCMVKPGDNLFQWRTQNVLPGIYLVHVGLNGTWISRKVLVK